MQLAKSLLPLVDFVFPPRCPLCGEGLSTNSGLCVACWDQLVIPGKPACAACARPFREGIRDGGLCAACQAHPPAHDGIAAATIYNDTSRKLVLAFKHGNQIALAALMARLISARLEGVEDDWIVVPVPLHRWRLWRRGFNQAALLASELGRLTGAQPCLDGLFRLKATPMLGELGASARQTVIAGSIAANPRRASAMSGAKILLVDDVLTSGATSGECVAALRAAGADRVVVACFARVIDEAL